MAPTGVRGIHVQVLAQVTSRSRTRKSLSPQNLTKEGIEMMYNSRCVYIHTYIDIYFNTLLHMKMDEFH